MTEEQVRELMERACAKLGGKCNYFPAKANRLIQRDDGWCYLGSLMVGAEKAYDVYWHDEKQKGWLWGWVKKVNGWERRAFMPVD